MYPIGQEISVHQIPCQASGLTELCVDQKLCMTVHIFSTTMRTTTQCDQIGLFSKDLVTTFPTLKRCSFLGKIASATFGVTLSGNLATFNSMIWSH